MPLGQFSVIRAVRGGVSAIVGLHERADHSRGRRGSAAAARRTRGHCLCGACRPRLGDHSRRRPLLCTAAQIPIPRHDQKLSWDGHHGEGRQRSCIRAWLQPSFVTPKDQPNQGLLYFVSATSVEALTFFSQRQRREGSQWPTSSSSKTMPTCAAFFNQCSGTPVTKQSARIHSRKHMRSFIRLESSTWFSPISSLVARPRAACG